MIKMSIF